MATTTTTYSFQKPTVGGDEDAWGGYLNANWDSVDDLLDGTTAIAPNLTLGSWQVGGVAVTATAAELNLLDGVTATTAELNYVDGVTSNIQTQIDTKAPKESPTFTTKIVTPKVEFSNWTITETGGVLYFATGGVNKMKLDASGNLTVAGDVTAFGTV